MLLLHLLRPNALTQKIYLYSSFVAGDLEQIKMTLSRGKRLTDSIRRVSGFDSSKHFVGTAEVTIRRHEEPAKGVVSALEVIELHPRFQSLVCLGKIKETLLVEKFLLYVPVQGFQLSVHLRDLGNKLVYAQFFEQLGEAAHSPPCPEGASSVGHDHLRSAVERDSFVEASDGSVHCLTVPDSSSRDKARKVIEEDEDVDVELVYVVVQEVEMPEEIGTRSLVAFVMDICAADLGMAIAVLFHDATYGMDTDLEPCTPELVADLCRAEARMCSPDFEYASISV